MTEYKLLFAGPVGAGKSTAIRSVSQSAVVNTDVANLDQSHDKALTTVGLDMGLITLEDGSRLRLFGTPGQMRFDFVWRVLANNVLGLVILSNNRSKNAIEETCEYLRTFLDYTGDAPVVVGVGHMDTHPQPDLSEYNEAIASAFDRIIPVVQVDVRKQEDTIMLIELLLAQIHQSS